MLGISALQKNPSGCCQPCRSSGGVEAWEIATGPLLRFVGFVFLIFFSTWSCSTWCSMKRRARNNPIFLEKKAASRDTGHIKWFKLFFVNFVNDHFRHVQRWERISHFIQSFDVRYLPLLCHNMYPPQTDAALYLTYKFIFIPLGMKFSETSTWTDSLEHPKRPRLNGLSPKTLLNLDRDQFGCQMVVKLTTP